jgi:acyl-coenzyme A thioesterase 13
MASLALTTSGLPPPTGVSVSINTEFLRPGGKEGDVIVMEGVVVKLGECFTDSTSNSADADGKVGRTLATTRINFYDNNEDKSKRKLLAYGSHTKHVEQAWKNAGGVSFPFDVP